MDAKSIQPELNKYLEKIKEQIRISQALLFGSIVANKSSSESDVDLLIVSDDFNRFNNDERSKLLYRASVGFPYDLHVFGVTSQELKSASPLTTLGSLQKSKTVRIQ